MKLYRRFAEVTFSGSGALAIRDLRIAFKVDKTVSGKPNVSVIEIWNLSATHRGQIKQEFDRLRLKAGYLGGEGEGGNVGVIFDGFIREVTHARKGTDIVTRIEAGDGDKASREGTVSVTLPAGTTPRQVVEVLIDHMPGVETGALLGLDGLPASPRPVVLSGPVTRELDKIGRTHGLYWSVQDGALEIIPASGAIKDVVVLSQATGLIGSPAVTDKGLKAECLLNPHIRVNRMIDVRSRLLDEINAGGLYRVSGLAFTGDNREGKFIARIDGERVEEAV